MFSPNQQSLCPSEENVGHFYSTILITRTHSPERYRLTIFPTFTLAQNVAHLRDPIVHIDIQLQANEIAAKLALLQSRVQTGTYVIHATTMRLAEITANFCKCFILGQGNYYNNRVSNLEKKLHSFTLRHNAQRCASYKPSPLSNCSKREITYFSCLLVPDASRGIRKGRSMYSIGSISSVTPPHKDLRTPCYAHPLGP